MKYFVLQALGRNSKCNRPAVKYDSSILLNEN